MTWEETLAAPPDHLELRFRKGTKREAGGEVLLVVAGDGRVSVDRRTGDVADHHEATLGRDEVLALFGALAATGYPRVPGHTVPPGPGMVSVEVLGGPEDAPAMLHRSFLRDLPAWLGLVERLDALAASVGRPG